MDTKTRTAGWINNSLYLTMVEVRKIVNDAKTSLELGMNIVSAENVAKLERMQTELAEIDEEVTKVINSNE